MSTPVLIIGESGSGKTYSIRNCDPAKTFFIQAVRKALPWKTDAKSGWHRWDGEKGNIFVSDKADTVIQLLKGTKKKVIILDDYQYILSNELLNRWKETGYGKFSEVGHNGINIFHTAMGLADDVHVYFMAHTMTGDDGITKIKTPGKLMETYSVEGLFSMVLRAVSKDGVNYFSTKNSGSDTVKAPVGMFTDEKGQDLELIPNDLTVVDKAITAYGW